ncbi:PKD domain-containing protein [Candidatus Bathyarchaeota archaeon]|nr:PKD domain-containing protein [Candidatus Bathyarchaeota archaeon]
MKLRSIHLVVIGILIIATMGLAMIKNGVTANGNQLPVASFTYSPSVPMPEDTIVFNASTSYDPDGWIVQYRWNFGDGNTITTADSTVTYAYPVDGNYTVELTVVDNNSGIGKTVVIVQVSTVAFFRVVYRGSLIPVSDVEVTVYYNNGTAWVKAPTGPSKSEVKYDNMTQPNLASTDAERFRNPGFTASILRSNASNIGFDIHPSTWTVFFKFKWGTFETYWPNDTTRVYNYKDGAVETHDYLSGHQAYWDPSASTYVIRVNDIHGNGVAPTESHPIIVGVLCPPPPQNYYLTVRTDPTGITTIPGQGSYAQYSNVTLTAPTTVNVTSTSSYRFTYWDVDGTSKGIGVNPITVCMNTNHTATAHYIQQYLVTFSQTGLTSDASSTIVTVNGSAKTYSSLPYSVWVDSGSSFTYSYASTVTSTTTGKRYRQTSVTGPASPFTVSSPVTVAGNYVTQYLVTFAQSGLDSTATGTVVTVNSSTKAHTDLPFGWWVDTGSTVTYSYSSIVSSTTPDKQFRLTGVNGPPPQFIVTEPTTITGYYCIQYLVRFTQSGLDSTATGTVVTVNGSAKTYSSLPYSVWVDSGSYFTYSYASTVSSSFGNKQFRLNSVTGPSSPFTVTGPTTVTGNYVVQYQVTFAQSGLDSSATGTVVTVNSSSKTYSQLPYSLWVDVGGSVTYSYNSPVSSSTSGKQFRLNSTSGPSSLFTVLASTTVTGNYVVQYLVTFAQSGLDSTAASTVVTVSGNAKVYTDLPFALWVDSSGSVTYSYNSIVSSSTAGKQFRLTSVTGFASPITVTGPTTVTGNYVVQYQVTFAQSGLDSTATGTVVTVNGSAKTYSSLPYSLWADSGSSVIYSYSSPVSSSTTGKRFGLSSVSGSASPITVTGPTTVTGNYVTQYQVTFDQSGVGTDFAGTVVSIDSINYGVSGLPASFWWDAGSSHTFAFSSPLTVNASKQYVWSSTSGLSNLQSGSLTITTSGSVVGNYVIQNNVTFDVTGAGTDFTSTALIVDGTNYGVSDLPISFAWQIGSNHTFAFQSPLLVTANTKRYVWTSTTGLSTLQSGSLAVTTFGSVIGNYKTQYYLSTSSPYGSVGGHGWYDSGTAAYATLDVGLIDQGNGTRRVFAQWNYNASGSNYAQSDPITMDAAKTAVAMWKTQYSVTFAHSGLDSSASSTVVTVNSVPVAFSQLPYSIWVDSGSSVTYSYSNVSSSSVGKRFLVTGVSGPSSPITVGSPLTVTGNYKTQYYLTVSSTYGTTSGQGWYDSGSTAYAALDTGVVDHGNGTRRVFTSWGSDASGANYAQSDPISMSGPKTAVANWKTQYSVTFTHSGLDSSASSTVVTINSIPVTFGQLPYSLWVDNSVSVTYSYDNVSSSTVGKRFILVGVSGPSSPITVGNPLTVTGNYKTQYQITFSQTGVSADFTGTIVTVDSTTYTFTTLPTSMWLDNGSTVTFAFNSPLVVNAGKQYVWSSTSGLSTLQSGTLTISGSGSITGTYTIQTKYEITFNQTGIASDFTGTVVIIDGTNYNLANLPHLFWWDSGSSHTFAYQSPLVVTPNVKRYVWVNTTGISNMQGGSIIVSASGAVVGNYDTQYYLTMATNPPGVNSPSGAGWFNTGTLATISTDAFVDIIPGTSRYRFNGWSTGDMTEIANPLTSPTTVLMDKGKTVTANYATQYNVTVNQSGVATDFTGTVVTIDSRDYNVTSLATSFWWDKGSTHNFAFQSPLVATSNIKRYVWTSTTGLSTMQSATISITSSGIITGNYKTQYLLTALTDPSVLTPQPTRNPTGEAGPANAWWYDSSISVTLTAQPVTGYTFDYWGIDGTSQGSGVNPAMAAMNGPHTATAHYKLAVQMAVTINPPSATITLGQSVGFTSNVTGGTPAYTYQWYLDGNPVSGATSSTWTFTPSATGIYFVFLKVTDFNGIAVQSDSARIVVISVPVGGYSVSLAKQSTPRLATYLTLVMLLGAMLSLRKRKKK